MPETFSVGSSVTEPIDFDLKQISATDSTKSAIDLTGYSSITLYLRSKKTDQTLSFDTAGGKITVPDADDGQVRFTPAQADLVFSDAEYECYFLVVDGAGDRIRIPDGKYDSPNVFLLKINEDFT